MPKQSKFEICEAIYAEMVTGKDKIPAAERRKVVAAFVDKAGCKPASANVYFSHIRNETHKKAAETLISTPKTPEPVEDHTAGITDSLDYDDSIDYDTSDDDAPSMLEEAMQ